MEAGLQIFKIKLAEFYATNDEKHRKELNEWLIKCQKDDQSWNLGWQILHQNNVTMDPIYEKLFALNCLYTKLTDSTFFDRFILESDGILNLGETLINLCENFSTIQLLISKCCACFVVYLLRTMPDIFSDPFKILKDRWYSGYPSILLDVYGSLIEEFRNLAQPLPRRNNVRSYLRQNEAFVANCAAELLQKTPVDLCTVQSAIKCVQSWISFDGCDLSDWKSIIVLCLSQLNLDSGDTISCLAKFFETFVENSQLIRMEKFAGQLFDYAESQSKSWERSDNSSKLWL
uniref:Uncharacterized protein n=1 Tax=Romanomermis culicivorax TaxID=13658 RepID=A0A915IVZ7_ROMCU